MAALAVIVTMALTSAASIPGQWALLDQAYERAVAMCGQLEWMLHRNAQMARLNQEVEEDLKKYLDPALNIALTAERNWQFAKAALAVDKTIMYVNAGILAVVMVVYVSLTWMILTRKSNVIKEAFEAVRAGA